MKKIQFNLGLSALLVLWLVWGSNMIGDMLFPGPEPRTDIVEETTETVAAAEEAAPAEPEAPPANPADLVADAASGKKVFNKCKACHDVSNAMKVKVGPPLHGVVGRAKAAFDGYSYSDALKSMGNEWTPENLYAFLASPSDYAPGNKMTFKGLKDPQDLADLVAFLATQGD